MVTIKEKSTGRMTLTFRDEDTLLTTPTSGSVKIIDVKSGTVIRDWEVINPTESSYVFYISSNENRILSRRNVTELRRVFVTFTYGLNQVGNDEYDYTIKNLSGVL